MSVTAILIRHAESEANLTRAFMDWPDASLTELGIKQAIEAGKQLKKMLAGRENKIKAVYCSPYRRAVDTCGIMLCQADLDVFDVIIDDRIRERGFGGKNSKIEGKTVDFFWEDGEKKENAITAEEYDGIWTKGDPLSKEFGIETLEDVEFRGGCFFDDLKTNEEYDEGIILIFTHGGFGRIANMICNGCPDGGRLFEIPFMKNCEIIEYVLD